MSAKKKEKRRGHFFKKATRTHGACKWASRGCDGVSAVCQLLLNIQRAPLGAAEKLFLTTHPGISLITCWTLWPGLHTLTISFPAATFKHTRATTPADNTEDCGSGPGWPKIEAQIQIYSFSDNTKYRGLILDWFPPLSRSCLHILVFERRRFSALTTQEFHSSTYTTLINYVDFAYFTPLFPPQRITQSFLMYWKT